MEILLLGLIATAITGTGLYAGNESIVNIIDKHPREATIWYLGHCGYAVKTQNHLLIFDYIELEETPHERGLSKGFVDPLEIKNRNVCVFVTHEHIDHFDEIILSWEQEIDTIRYFYGWQLNNNEKYNCLAGPRAEYIADDMEIYTVNSRHSQVPEVAFLVKIDGLVIYHGGDYQGKMGKNASSNVESDMEYLMAKIDSVDIFFVGAWTGEPYIRSIQTLKPGIIFPMHDRKKEYKYKQFALDLKKLGIDTPVICPEKRGDCFRFLNGKIETVP